MIFYRYTGLSSMVVIFTSPKPVSKFLKNARGGGAGFDKLATEHGQKS